MELMTQQNVETIGNQLGNFICSESSSSTASQRKTFLRFKALIPLNIPLVVGFYQSWINKPPFWVQFKYERLSDLCFACGRQGHAKIYYPEDPNLPSPTPFGPKMRANPPSPHKIDQIFSCTTPFVHATILYVPPTNPDASSSSLEPMDATVSTTFPPNATRHGKSRAYQTPLTHPPLVRSRPLQPPIPLHRILTPTLTPPQTMQAFLWHCWMRRTLLLLSLHKSTPI